MGSVLDLWICDNQKGVFPDRIIAMVLEPILCPSCGSDNIIKHGQSDEGKQRYKCRNSERSRCTFVQAYSYRGYLPEVKQQISEMAMNSSGIRDPARVLRISPTTVIENLKKSRELKAVNEARLAAIAASQTIVRLCQWEEVEAELDEMWSFVGSKQHQRWLWHAVDHQTGEVLAYVVAEHNDTAFVELKALLVPFGMTQFYTDGWGAYERHLEPVFHTVGKVHTQTIERQHLTLRTRMKRLAHKTICFSKLEGLHDTVIGMFINRFEFGLQI